MQEFRKKNLLVIYQDAKSNVNTGRLGDIFDIILVPQMNKYNSKNFKKKGNQLVTRYNDILFAKNSDFIFFICSSELNNNIVKWLLEFDGLKNDFDFFIFLRSNKLIEYLSGFVAKTEILMRIGLFNKHTFHNLFLNFLINYSLYIGMVNENTFSGINIGILNYIKYSYRKKYENSFYLSQPLLVKDYLLLIKKMDTMVENNIFKKIVGYFIKYAMNIFSSKIEKFVKFNTYVEYW